MCRIAGVGSSGYVFYGLTGKSVPAGSVCRSSSFGMVLSTDPTAGKRTLVLPGRRCTGVFRVRSRALTGTTGLTGGVVARRGSILNYKNCGLMRGGNRITNRAMFRFRVRLVPECRSSSGGGIVR